MPDYPFENLNTRSFEQLVQALACKVIGPHILIYGDGRDGGREATFKGQMGVPGKSHWNGFGIIQVKFKQILDTSEPKNTTWALSQLNEDFQKFSSRLLESQENERVCPEYYIFATNVVLTSVAKSGGKDKIESALNGYIKSHGLKDFDKSSFH